MTKICTKCGIEKDITEFYVDKRHKEETRFLAQCKLCILTHQKLYQQNNPERTRATKRKWRAANIEKHRETSRLLMRRKVASGKNAEDRRLKLYGITPEEFKRLFESQDRRCAICKSDIPRRKGGIAWHLDHDHITGQVRGILCTKCNLGLGYFNDDEELLETAIAYIRSSKVQRKAA